MFIFQLIICLQYVYNMLTVNYKVLLCLYTAITFISSLSSLYTFETLVFDNLHFSLISARL